MSHKWNPTNGQDGLLITKLFQPKHGGLEDDFPFQLGDFWILCYDIVEFLSTNRRPINLESGSFLGDELFYAFFLH